MLRSSTTIRNPSGNAFCCNSLDDKALSWTTVHKTDMDSYPNTRTQHVFLCQDTSSWSKYLRAWWCGWIFIWFHHLHRGDDTPPAPDKHKILIGSQGTLLWLVTSPVGFDVYRMKMMKSSFPLHTHPFHCSKEPLWNPRKKTKTKHCLWLPSSLQPFHHQLQRSEGEPWDCWRLCYIDDNKINHVHLTKLFTKSLGWVVVDDYPNIWLIMMIGIIQLITLISSHWLIGTPGYDWLISSHWLISAKMKINREDFSRDVLQGLPKKRFLGSLDLSPEVQWLVLWGHIDNA